MLRRWDRPVEMILRLRLPDELGQAGKPAWSVRLTILSSLLGTFTDPLSRHPEPPDVRRTAIVHAVPSRVVLAGECEPSMMRAAVSENRRTARCFVCVGSGREEERGEAPA